MKTPLPEKSDKSALTKHNTSTTTALALELTVIAFFAMAAYALIVQPLVSLVRVML